MKPFGLIRRGFLLVFLGFAGCASDLGSESSSPMGMLESYQKMSEELAETPTFSTYEPYLSKELQAAIRSDLGPNVDEHVQFLAAPLWFERVVETHQGTVEDRECLVVNGLSVDGDPISAALEYVERAEMIKIRAVEIAMFEPGESLPSETWCPVRADEF